MKTLAKNIWVNSSVGTNIRFVFRYSGTLIRSDKSTYLPHRGIFYKIRETNKNNIH